MGPAAFFSGEPFLSRQSVSGTRRTGGHPEAAWHGMASGIMVWHGMASMPIDHISCSPHAQIANSYLLGLDISLSRI
jgi:hypothetical protein